MQLDPIGIKDGLNRYAYMRNSPLMGVDPTGLQAVTPAPIPLPLPLPPIGDPNSKENKEWVKGAESLISKMAGETEKIQSSDSAGPRIEPDKQWKHVPGHKNFDTEKSELTDPDPQGLVDRHARTGDQVGKIEVSEHCSRERVDFGKIIGNFAEEGIEEKIPTQNKIIHYSKKGVHIVPSRPNRMGERNDFRF